MAKSEVKTTIKLTKKSSHKQIIAAWVEALNSGEYKQTKGLLRKKDSFCCLGVLCELAVAAKVTDKDYEGETIVLPDSVVKWASMRYKNASFGDETSLAQINDAGKKFKTIAKIIESNPEGLFV